LDQEELSLNSAIPFAGRYVLKKLLGSGGMGAVYLAVDSMLGDDEVALKVLHSQLCKNEKHTKRFLREVQLTRKVTHPNVVRTFDAGRENGRLYFTMECAEGVTLKEKLQAGPFDLHEAASILREIAKGLYAIHEADIIHRDLKPGNVILTPDGFVKITDFGVAKPGVSDLTGHNEIIGSIPYMAPEVWVGRNVGPAADLYALGVLAYEMITGHLPFEGDSPAELMCKHIEARPIPPVDSRPETPVWLNALTMKLLEKEQENRPKGAADVVLFINECLDGSGSAKSELEVPPTLETVARPTSAIEYEEPLVLHNSNFDAPPPGMTARSTRPLGHAWGDVPQYVSMPVEEKLEHDDYRGFSKLQRVLRRGAVAGSCIALCCMIFYVLEAQTFGYLKAKWDISQQYPLWSAVLWSMFANLVVHSMILSMPIFLLAACRRPLRESLTVWLRGALLLAAIAMALCVANIWQTVKFSRAAGSPVVVEQAFSGVEAALVNTREIALLAPLGTTHAAVLKGRSIVYQEVSSASAWHLTSYYGLLAVYLLVISRIVEKRILVRASRDKKFLFGFFGLVGVLPLSAEYIFFQISSLARELFALRDLKFTAGPVVHLFDRFTVTCSILNWALFAGAALFGAAFFLAKLKKRRG
jgi:serine/threonine protein kinase